MRGVEVLQAAVEGKRIRPADVRWQFPGERWLTLDEKRRWFWDENHTPVGFSVNSLFTQDWDIEDPPMTFTEAWAALKHGDRVERPHPGGVEQYTLDILGGLWMRLIFAGVEGPWAEGAVGAEQIDAVDWRLVTEVLQDVRPTRAEFAQWASDHLVDIPPLEGAEEPVVHEMMRRWPGMFREEEA